MEQYYRKAEIDGKEENLPKGNEPYISHSNSGHIAFRRCVPDKREDYATFENISGTWWLKNIDWYLQPEPMPTDEDIEIIACDYATETNIIADRDLVITKAFIEGAKAMRDGKIKTKVK
jgi:hypothetical protein